MMIQMVSGTSIEHGAYSKQMVMNTGRIIRRSASMQTVITFPENLFFILILSQRSRNANNGQDADVDGSTDDCERLC